jgi:hypothetical protein
MLVLKGRPGFEKKRDDGSIGALEREIESVYGLPKYSLRLVKPNGWKIRSDGTVATLRKAW